MATTNQITFEQVLDAETYGAGDPTTFGLPLDLFDQMRADMPCVKLQLEHPLLIDEVWCISRHEDMSALLMDNQRFKSSVNVPLITRFGPVDPVERPGIFAQDGEIHRRRRNELGKALRHKAILRLEKQFREITVDLLDRVLPQGTFEFIESIAHPMPTRAVGDILGVPEEDREKFYRWADGFISPFDERFATKVELALESLTGIWAYALEVTEEKRRTPQDDMLTVLAQTDASPGEIQGNVATLAAGAAETTRAVLGHALHELMRNEEQMAWLRERADDIPMTAVNELLRIAAPVVHNARTATEDFELHGQLIKEGDMLAFLLPSGSHDPEVFDEPRRFDLTRKPNLHMAFGNGPHKCIGQHVGALEIKIVLEELLQRTRDIRPAGPISYVKGNLTRGVYSLPITVTPA